MPMDMTGFEVTRSRAVQAGRSRRSRLNRWLTVALVVLLVLFPIPLGANRPVFWALNATAIGLLALVYGIAMLRMGEAFRFSPRRMRVLTAVWAMLCIYIAVQLLPIGSFGVETRWGDTITTEGISIAPGMTLLSLVQFISFAIFFFLVLQVASNGARALAVAEAAFAIIAGFAVYGILALTQFGDTLLFFEKWAYEGSATATFVNRNSYATFLAFGLTLGAALVVRKLAGTNNGGRPPGSVLVLYGVGLATILAALLLTRSRMGLAAGLAGAFFVLLAGGIKVGRTRPGRGLPLIWVAVAAAIGVAAALGGGTLERLGGVEQSFDVRAELYAQIAFLIAQRPWLGFGAGTFELAFPLVQDLPVSPDLVWDKAHSTYLSLWAEMGLVFGSLPLLAVGLIGMRCLVLFIRQTTDWALPLAALGAIIAGALHSVVDFSLEMQANAFLFAAILALGMAGDSDYEPRGGRP